MTEFVDIYEENVWGVYGFFTYRGLSAQDAEDLAQLTFERAFEAFASFDPERAAPATWLLAIAHNAYVDHRRREGGRRRDAEDVAASWGLTATSSPGPEDELGSLSPELAGAISRLRTNEREAIALRFGGDLRGPEIAEIMGLSLVNVQQILSRGLRKLRRELERSEPERAAAGESKPGDGEQ